MTPERPATVAAAPGTASVVTPSAGLADATAAATTLKQQIDLALEPAQRLWAQLDGAKRQLDNLKQQADAAATRFRKALDDATKALDEARKAVEAVAPIAADYASYLANTVGPLNCNLARWVFDDRSVTNPFTAGDVILARLNGVYSKTNDAGRSTLDGIKAGIEKVKQHTNDLVAKKQDFEAGRVWHPSDDDAHHLLQAYHKAQAALMIR